MKSTAAIGLKNAQIRPIKHAADQKTSGFPVYDKLVDTLLDLPEPDAAAPMPDATARHLCAVLSTWSYSDPDTVAQMMVRMGLEQNQCRYKEISNNANFVRSSAYLVQSKCGRVVLLAYRGTDPFDLSTWAVSSDANTVLVPVSADGEGPRVHGGFYRNQRATWYDVVAALKLAARGHSILSDQDYKGKPKTSAQLKGWNGTTRLFITGHSLGGAMAQLAAYRLMSDPAYAHADAKQPALRPLLHSVYTFAQPMVGNDAFAQHCTELLSGRLFCHTYREDIVPRLPPDGLGTRFAHAGDHFITTPRGGDPSGPQYEWQKADANPEPAASVLAIAEAGLGMLTQYKAGKAIVDEGARHLKFLRNLSNRLQATEQRPEMLLTTTGDFVSRGAGHVFGNLVNALERAVPGPLKQLLPTFEPEKKPRKTRNEDYSFTFHAPMNYLATSQPAGKLTEFGDDF